VAQIRGKPIYVVSDVALIPLSSRTAAAQAISQAKKTSKAGKKPSAETGDTDDEDDAASATTLTEVEDHESPAHSPAEPPGTPELQTPLSPRKKGTSVVTNVIQNRGNYGRFAERWFSKSGWRASASRKQTMSDEEDDLTREQKRQGLEALPEEQGEGEAPLVGVEADKAATDKGQTEEAATEESPKPPNLPSQDVLQSLAPKILRTIKLFFAANSFFFSYDYDISHTISEQDSSSSTLPLFKRFEPLVSHSF